MPLFRDNPELLVPFREGQPRALEVVYRFYVRPTDSYLRALARFTQVAELAQPSAIADLLQEVFVRAFSGQARSSYDGLREFSPYLNTIARNCFMDALRRRRKEVLQLRDDEPRLELGTESSQVYDPKILAVLRAYLNDLPPELRGIYEQRFVSGVSQDIACLKLGISRRTLRTGEDRLRSGLRKALQLAGLLHEMHSRAGLDSAASTEQGWRPNV
jgi:RNA polymerase sigma-70 factor (ECF subfamily)